MNFEEIVMNFFVKETKVFTTVGIMLFFFGIVSGLFYIGNLADLKNAKEKKDGSENIYLNYCLTGRTVDILKSFIIAVIGILIIWVTFFV